MNISSNTIQEREIDDLEAQWDTFEQLLDEYDIRSEELFYDEPRDEYYFIAEYENGTPGEDGYDAGFEKVYVPELSELKDRLDP